MDLVERLSAGVGDFLLFAITPPRASTKPERLGTIADSTLARLQSVGPDGLVLYDIAEESDRNPRERPFPYLETIDPAEYLKGFLSGWTGPAVVYRATSKHSEAQFRGWLESQDPGRVLSVLVGASSSRSTDPLSLRRAYELRRVLQPNLVTGAVAIPERHAVRGDEHHRMLDKQAAGCSFFVTQILFDVNAAKNLVCDYLDECVVRGMRPRPIAFTLSLCGSAKTLDFMNWLGVRVPHWIQRDLTASDDTLGVSYDHALTVAADMLGYCRRLGVPAGLNVESVSTRRVEIEAAARLAVELSAAVRRQ